MKSPLIPLALLLSFTSTVVAGDLTASERAALAGPSSPDLAALRGGEAQTAPVVVEGERLVLARATASAPELGELRAGDLDDHDLAVIGIVVAVVALAIIIF